MKLKKIIATTMLSAVVLGAVAPASLAVPVGDATTKGIVTFEKAGEDPTPTDPTKPDVDPLDPDVDHPGTTGPLRFDWLPVLDFGSVKLDGRAVSQSVKHDKYTLKNPATTFYAAPTVEISDARGSNAGWHATVEAEDFQLMKSNITEGAETGAEAATLEGAKIIISAATINTHSGIVGKKPTSSISGAPLTIDAKKGNTAKTFVTAADGDGMSQWSIGFSDDTNADGYINKHATQGTDKNVKLAIPAEAKKLEGRVYQANLVWTLLDTPA